MGIVPSEEAKNAVPVQQTSLVAHKSLNIIDIKKKDKLLQTNKQKITWVQLDPNGLCNAGCWFCPVKYEGNNKAAQENMSIELMESILKQLDAGKGDFVEPLMYVIVPFNFNEVLLYPHFEEMLLLMRKYKFKIPISTNGVPLTKSKVDIIKKYPDVVGRINLNVPSAFEEEWAEFTNFNPKLFNKVIDNIAYAVQELTDWTSKAKLCWMFNHIDEDGANEETGWGKLLENAPNIDLDKENGTLAKTMKKFQEMFPEIYYEKNHEILDRMGFLDRVGVFTNQDYIKKHIKKDKTKVIGCSFDGENQAVDILHINANGDVHLCCQDFNFESVYANVKEKSLRDIWYSIERKKAVAEAYNTFCKECQYAVWE
ncbi:MAG: radical SAM protein [Chitinophagia bacterium]|nr:radical SAM protein [Chitinophagia bacterium]